MIVDPDETIRLRTTIQRMRARISKLTAQREDARNKMDESDVRADELEKKLTASQAALAVSLRAERAYHDLYDAVTVWREANVSDDTAWHLSLAGIANAHDEIGKAGSDEG